MTDRHTRDIVLAGHEGRLDDVCRALVDPDPEVRAAALGALDRLGQLDPTVLAGALVDDDPGVRRRAAELAATRPGTDLRVALADPDPGVVEVAAWACGEHERFDDDVRDDVLSRLSELTTAHDDALVREAAAAALGAIGDERGLTAVLAACADRPAVRRRAVLALAPFLDGPRDAEVRAALARALEDRDWQVRQSAEDLIRAVTTTLDAVPDPEPEDDGEG